MIQYLKIDANGFYIEPVLFNDGDTIPSDCVLPYDPSQSFYKPKWNGSQWIEGLAQDQLLSNAQQQKIAQLRSQYEQTLSNGFKAMIGNTTYTFGWATQDQINLNSTQTAVSKGYAAFPITYADASGNPVALSIQADLDTIEQEATKFAFAQHQQILNLVGQTQSATTTDAVNAVQWTAASY